MADDLLFGVAVPDQLRTVNRQALEQFICAVLERWTTFPLANGGGDRTGREDRNRHSHRPLPNGMVDPDPGTQEQPHLVFSHDCCVFPSCRRATCTMCSNAQQTGCTENSFKRAYEDEVLTPECGANSMWVDVRMDGQMLAAAQLAKAAVQFVLLDGQEVLRGQDWESCQLTACQGRILLQSKGQPVGPNGLVTCPLQWDELQQQFRAAMPDLFITVSSTSARKKLGLPALKGQASYCLLARLVDASTHAALPMISPVISKPFRVVVDKAGEAKSAKALLDDPVHSVPGIGPETLTKLRNIGEHAEARGLFLPFSTIETVRDLRELVRWSRQREEGREREVQIKALLKMKKSVWNSVQQQAMSALENDNFLRIWVPKTGTYVEPGLLFECIRGSIRTDVPTALLERVVEEPATGRQAFLNISALNPPDLATQSIQAMVKAARADWLIGGHPNWAMWDVVSGDFLKQWHVPEDKQWAPSLASGAESEEVAERLKMRIASPPPWSAVSSGAALPSPDAAALVSPFMNVPSPFGALSGDRVPQGSGDPFSQGSLQNSGGQRFVSKGSASQEQVDSRGDANGGDVSETKSGMSMQSMEGNSTPCDEQPSGTNQFDAWHLHYMMSDGENGANPGAFLANLPGIEGPELMTRLSQRLSHMGMSVDGMESVTNWDEVLAHGGLESLPPGGISAFLAAMTEQQNLQQENGGNASSPSAAVPVTFQLNASANATEMTLSPPTTPNFTSGVMTPVRRPGQGLTAAALQAAYAATPPNGNAGGAGQQLGGHHGSGARSGSTPKSMSTSSSICPQPLIHQPVLTSLPTIQVPERVSSAPVPSSSQPVWSPFNGPGFHMDAVTNSMTMHSSLDYRTHPGFADFGALHPQTAADVPAGRVDLGGRGLEIPQPGAAGVTQWLVDCRNDPYLPLKAP